MSNKVVHYLPFRVPGYSLQATPRCGTHLGLCAEPFKFVYRASDLAPGERLCKRCERARKLTYRQARARLSRWLRKQGLPALAEERKANNA